jgi:putative ABC transport system permease protein
VISLWTFGLLRRRFGRLAATAAGVAAAVALLACLGSFLDSAQNTMTERATRTVVVDWQVEVQPGASLATVLDTVQRAPHVRAALPVGFARSSGLTAANDGMSRMTGAAMILGIPPDYNSLFPGSVRTLVGADRGVLVAQQTAANLGVVPGDTVQIQRAGMAPASVVVDGVVELRQADSLFQKVGAPRGAQPAAPPDNVLILDEAQWHNVFDPLAAPHPDLVNAQIHTRIDHNLPPDPAAAYTQVTAAAHNLEAQSAGAALVGDNLGAALDAARGDAAYARILFLFLGLPAAALAALLTATIVSAGAPRRRFEQALLRARGASSAQLIRLATVEAAIVGILGSAVGLIAAAAIGSLSFGSTSFGANAGAAIGWAAGSAAAGLAIAAAVVLLPAWHDIHRATVTEGRVSVRRDLPPIWSRFGLDIILLCAAGVLFWSGGRSGYQIVLAPEGVPSISVSYWAFAAPALLWVGGTLFIWRLAELLLRRGRPGVAVLIRPVAGRLSRILSRSLSRQRAPLATAIVLLALAAAFAASTAAFTETYQAQAEADAKLTNGADVAVTVSPGAQLPADTIKRLAALPGVRAVEPIQHRFAYIGSDVQDLYGIDPASIGSVTALQDSYFQGGSASSLMNRLENQPDSILVSAETVSDFQLAVGDMINLRLQNSETGQLVTVPFRYVGVVTEFPTAPKDSFFVANAGFVERQTRSDAIGTFLVDTGGRDTTAVAVRVRALLGTSATVTDIAATRDRVGSSLTAVNLAGLARVELGFGLCLAVAGGGLVLGLGLAERRRTFALARALGATRRQVRAFVAAEALTLIVCGLIAGAALSWGLSRMLVAVLTGVFDPPPTSLSVPWGYLVRIGLTAIAAIAGASAITLWLARRSPPSVFGER